MSNYPNSIDDASSLYSPVDAYSAAPARTTLAASSLKTDTTLQLTNANVGFAAQYGIVSIGDDKILYTSISGNNLIGCVHLNPGTAIGHTQGTAVIALFVSDYFLALQQSIIAIQNVIGVLGAYNFGTGGGGSGAVNSVFGRAGDVIAQAGDYTATQIGLGNVTNDAQLKSADLVTTVANPGSNSKVPSEAAVRAALGAGSAQTPWASDISGAGFKLSGVAGIGVNDVNARYAVMLAKDATGASFVVAIENPHASGAGNKAGLVFRANDSTGSSLYSTGLIYGVFDTNTFSAGRLTIAYPTGDDVFVDLISFINGKVGIGTTSPSSPLTVAGIVESTSGGFKFPDGTTQTTTAAPTFVGAATLGSSNPFTATAASNTAVIFTTSNLFDTSSIHSTVTNPSRFTVPSTGYYSFKMAGTAEISTSGGTVTGYGIFLYYRVNGGTLQLLYSQFNPYPLGNFTTEDLPLISSVDLQLTAGDYFEWVVGIQAGAFSAIVYPNYASCAKIGS